MSVATDIAAGPNVFTRSARVTQGLLKDLGPDGVRLAVLVPEFDMAVQAVIAQYSKQGIMLEERNRQYWQLQPGDLRPTELAAGYEVFVALYVLAPVGYVGKLPGISYERAVRARGK